MTQKEHTKMKITKRQLRRIIKEELGTDRGNYQPNITNTLESRLLAVWDVIRADTLEALGGRAKWDEIADEVLSSGYAVDPDLIETINRLSPDKQDALFQKVFGAGSRW
jgi:hypothetical protein